MSPPTCFGLSKAHLIGPFASKNVTLALIKTKKNLKGPLSLKPTTVPCSAGPDMQLAQSSFPYVVGLFHAIPKKTEETATLAVFP